METEATLPDDARRWVADRLAGVVASVTDVSWSRGTSRVWRVVCDERMAYVKLSPSRRHYEREVHAYRHVVRSLGPGAAPRLLATDANQHLLMTSSLPGLVVRGLELEPAVERRVHERAGRLLRRWHGRVETVSETTRAEVRKSLTSQADEAAECLARSARHLTREQAVLVRRVCEELPDLAGRLPIVFCHGDYSPRNWLWDAEHASCGVIDFERSGHDVAVSDLVWLCGAIWPGRTDLAEAFLAGYGRALTEAERRALPLLTARLAVSYLATGLANGDPVLVERGSNALADLVHADP